MKSVGRCGLILLFGVALIGCRTTNVSECNMTIRTALTNDFAMFTTILQSANFAKWKVGGMKPGVVRVSFEHGRHVLTGDLFYKNGVYDFKLVDAINLMYDPESGDIHRNCPHWIRGLMEWVRKVSDGCVVSWNEPYKVRSRIVSLTPGRQLKDVLRATFENYGVATVDVSPDLLRAQMGSDDERMSLDVKYSPVAYSINQVRLPNAKTDGSQYNLFLLWIDQDIVRYADIQEYNAERRARQAHADRQQMVSAMWGITGAIMEGNAIRARGNEINRQGWNQLNDNIRQNNEINRQGFRQTNSSLNNLDNTIRTW